MKRFVFICLFIGILLFMAEDYQLYCQKFPLKLPKKIPFLDDIIKSEPPISTNLSDAVTDVPFLDDLDFDRPISLVYLPRNEEGGFILERTGSYIFECQSYCLQAGTYAPGHGEGYLYAPLKGPQANIVHNILKNSVHHPEIPQKDIQVLLWAIIARTKLSDMSK